MNPYRYFSLALSYPTEEILNEIREQRRVDDSSDPRCGDVISSVPLEEAQAEYTRLFVSAYPAVLCPPYESYYREGIVYGQSSVEVSEWYKRNGLRFTYEGEPPDFVSVELDYLAMTNDSLFLSRMKEWVFDFIDRVKQHSPLYRPCVSELEAFLKRTNT